MRVNVDAITKVMRGGGGVDAAFAKSLLTLVVVTTRRTLRICVAREIKSGLPICPKNTIV